MVDCQPELPLVFRCCGSGQAWGGTLTLAAVLCLADVITAHPYNNVTESIFQKIGTNLHQQPNHPLGILKARQWRLEGSPAADVQCSRLAVLERA